ncbi:hypothetical protein [Fictibacillus phosphorivorans]|uniref:hypothetical protein n=1 Tax=Fictibacillus phosphorivorans TaxID=1221500 RepID=UPI00203C0733|nr:hypothetical protein [Fictibacillus phosphorivorans]MCM3718197.1 hypothetical protein [Fictibacillus phosphorivorans]MCM3775936.1 hypothetical protein [Fictibacillus phosphorivorans]
MSKNKPVLSHRELCKLLGQWIQVNTGGPESRVGRLVCVGQDFLAIQNLDKDGKGKRKGKGKGKGGKQGNELVFYQLSHVKAIVLQADGLCCKWKNKKSCIDDTFRCVLKHFINHKVKINRGGPESVEGVLVAVGHNSIEIINGDEVIILAIHHIKSFSQIGGCREESSHKKESSSKNSSSKEESNSQKKESSNKKK